MEGIYKVTQKIKRKTFLDNICPVCKKCKNHCNRKKFEKCDECINCKENCLKYCDRYYCFEKWLVQITINGKQKTVATAKTKKEAKEKKKFFESKNLTGTYVNKNLINILQLIKKADNKKLESGVIKQTTYNRNQYQYNKIEKSNINKIPVQKLTYNDIQSFLNMQRYSSQSEIDRIAQKLDIGFNEAIIDKIIAYPDNPMLRIQRPLSYQNKKIRIPLNLEDEIRFLEFLATEDIIVKSYKSLCTNNTIRNLFIISLFTGCRIGELASLDYNKHIDFKNKYIIVERTLTEDEEKNMIIGNNTKTGNHKKRKNKKDIHYIPFGIFDEECMIYILKNQIKETKSIENNRNNLLFCDKTGNLIKHTSVNGIFKRICVQLNIQYDSYSESLSLHSTRHTAITRMIEMGMDLKIIASIAGHANTRQIEDTYGHILQEFQMRQVTCPGSYYKKEDVITNELKKLLLNIYSNDKNNV